MLSNLIKSRTGRESELERQVEDAETNKKQASNVGEMGRQTWSESAPAELLGDSKVISPSRGGQASA